MSGTGNWKGTYFEIPGRCVPCPRPRGRRGQKAYYPKRYTDWLESARVEALRAAGRFLWDGPVGVEVNFIGVRPNADIDNLLKSVFDAIQGVIIEDDKQVVSVKAHKQVSRTGRFTQVHVNPWGLA